MSKIENLFELIREHKWDQFKTLLETDEPYDPNARDVHGNYLLTYAVKFNKYDAVCLLLENNAKYDIVDNDERSIIYYAIESGFYPIVEKLLEKSANGVGVLIVNMRDIHGNTPIHYAIKLKNIKILRLLMRYEPNLYTKNSEGYNALHLAIRTGSYESAECIATQMIDLSVKTQKGETALHIAINFYHTTIANYLIDHHADPNIAETTNEFTPLHYAVAWDNIAVVKNLLAHKANPDLQDIYGNTPLMYCVKENHDECFQLIINAKPNVNLWNIEGKILLHEIMEKLESVGNDYKNLMDDRMLGQLITMSNMSFQDSYGNTCLHYLIQYDLWKKYANLLEHKKLNIFAKNSDQIAPIDLITKNDTKQFVRIIATSYVNLLKREQKNWVTELDKICSRDFSELTDSERKQFKIDDPNKCTDLIYAKLIADISKYTKGTLTYCQRSYPTKIRDNECVEIKEGAMLDVCTFTGSMLDILIGLLYLLKTHDNACAMISQQIHGNANSELCKFYKSLGVVMDKRCQFLSFEIVWIDYKLYMIENFTNLFEACIKSNARFVIIPLGIELKTGAHANYLIYDKDTKELERFEPHGGTTPFGFNYNTQNLDKILEQYFTSYDHEIKYIGPNEYTPKIGFQIMDTQEKNNQRIGDPAGFCALWCIWYVDHRLQYHQYDRKKLLKILFENIRMGGYGYRNMIRNYSRVIIDERDKLLEKVGITVNDWMNENYTNNQLDQLLGMLARETAKCCNK